MIIGFCGPNGAGKTTACLFLKKKGFLYFSLSDIIREELKKEGKEINRENLTIKGNELRKKYGSDILAKICFEKVKNLNKNVVIDSIRNIYEVKFLKSINNFTLIGITAKPENRYKRIISRNRKDIKSYEEFLKQEEIENSDERYKQNINKVLEMCDYIINNNSSLEAFYKKIEEVVNKILLK